MIRPVLGAGICAVALVAAGCSGGSGGREASAGFGKLVWEDPPKVYTPKTLPHDRILAGRVKNDSLRKVELVAHKDVKLVDASGRSVPHTAIFIDGFTRDIYPPRSRRRLPEQDQLRLGYRARLEPGDARPLTVAWRVKDPKRAPVRIDLPGGILKLPPGD